MAMQEEGALHGRRGAEPEPEPEPDEGGVPLSEARGIHKRAHLFDEGPARGQQEPSITRRNRGEQAQFPLRAALAFRSVLGAPQMRDPSLLVTHDF
jgi:hypothetical protein